MKISLSLFLSLVPRLSFFFFFEGGSRERVWYTIILCTTSTLCNWLLWIHQHMHVQRSLSPLSLNGRGSSFDQGTQTCAPIRFAKQPTGWHLIITQHPWTAYQGFVAGSKTIQCRLVIHNNIVAFQFIVPWYSILLQYSMVASTHSVKNSTKR